MKKSIYLCFLVLLCMSVKAQIDPNWEPYFVEEFTSNHYWNSTNWYSMPDQYWKAYLGNTITHGDREGQVYQYDHCQFDQNEGVVKLISGFDNDGDIPNHNYDLPSALHGSYPNEFGNNDGLYFFSGEITAFPNAKFGFGYFEIKCKLPIHNGSFPAFWLFGNGPNNYEEIDIFEYSEGDCEGDASRGHSTGIWYNPYSTQYVDPNGGDNHAMNFAKIHHHLALTEPDLSEYHTFGCEWMPDYVRWYRDGKIIAEDYDSSHIPKYPKTLIVNYAIIRDYALDQYLQPFGWSGSDVMTIDYVKVYKLKTDCGTDELITTGTQFATFDHKMKRSITIGSPGGPVIVPENTNVSMHAEQSVTIDGEFEIPVGSQMTLSVHTCP